MHAFRDVHRGKAHASRPADVVSQDMFTGYLTVVTACGRVLRFAEQVELDQTAPEDRCRICWRKEGSDV